MKVILITIHKGESKLLIDTLDSIIPYLKHPLIGGLLIYESGGKSLPDNFTKLNSNKIKYLYNNSSLGITDALNKSQKLSEVYFPDSSHHCYIHSGDKIIQNKDIFSSLKYINQNHSNKDLIFWNNKYVSFYQSDKLIPIFKDIKYGMSVMHIGTIISNKLHSSLDGYSIKYKFAMDYDFFLKSFLVKANYVELKCEFIEMDANGVSTQNAFKSIREVSKSIFNNISFPSNIFLGTYVLIKSYLRRIIYTSLNNLPNLRNKLRLVFNKRINSIQKH